jgi:hypothetical protein
VVLDKADLNLLVMDFLITEVCVSYAFGAVLALRLGSSPFAYLWIALPYLHAGLHGRSKSI